jgi:hypothetical protein
MINSQVFQLNGELGQRKFGRKGYLNLNLVYGNNIKKSQGSGHETKMTGTNVSNDLNLMFKLTPWTRGVLSFAMSKFDNDRHDYKVKRRDGSYEVRKGVFIPNWYLPVHLGGYGIDPESTFKVTRHQRLVAQYFIDNPKESLYRSKGIKIPLDLAPGAMDTVKLIPKDDLDLNKMWRHSTCLIDESSNEWLNRFAYLARTMHRYDDGDRAQSINVGFNFDHEVKKLITFEELKRYWDPYFVVHPGPTCPPFKQLIIPKSVIAFTDDEKSEIKLKLIQSNLSTKIGRLVSQRIESKRRLGDLVGVDSGSLFDLVRNTGSVSNTFGNLISTGTAMFWKIVAELDE